MDLSKLLVKFVIFLVLMLIGYFYSRKKLVGGDFTKGASRLTLEVFMSASILNSVIANPPQLGGGELLKVLLLLSLSMVLCYILALVLTRLLPAKLKTDAPVLELLMAVPNTMFIALPVLQEVLGNEAVFYVALSNIPFNLLLYTYGIMRLKGGGSGSFKAKDFFTVPLIATVLSVLIFILRVDMPVVVRELITSMSAVTMPLSMFVIGASLGGVEPLDALRTPHAYIVSLVKLIVSPLLVYLIMGLFIPDPFLLTICTVIAGSPCGIIVSVLAIQYGHDAVYSSKAILMSTVLAMLTMPVMVYLIMG